MQPTMQQRLTNLIRGGMAFTLAATLTVPTTALAEANTESAIAENSAQEATAEAGSDEATYVATGAEADEITYEGEGGSPALDTDATADQVGDGNGKVTIVVQLEEGGDQGISLFSNLLGTQTQDRHNYFKNKVREIAKGETDGGGISLMSLAATISGQNADDSADTSVDELHDYYNVIDGFAVKAPAKTLDAIKNLDGVKNAFIEHEYSVPADQQDSGVALKNQASLDITQADELDQKGDGQLVAIIDTGIDTDHDAFSGDLDDSAVALTKGEAAQARSTMKSGGRNGAYISEKIPFAYDYADGDAEVNPSISGLEHGTHVAGIAAANGGEIRGTAPNAQIAVMKVASDSNGSIYDSALIAAMDDIPSLGASSVNISIGADAGFADEGDATYTDAINSLESKGITVNVAAGNSYSAGKYNTSATGDDFGKGLPYATDPDSSMQSTPATISGSFAVASMNTDKVEVEEAAPTYITAPDGVKMQYWEAKDPEGNVRSKKFADLADGSYEMVWGDIGKTSGAAQCGDVDPNGGSDSLKGKVVLVYGHGNFYGSEQSYARVTAAMSALGAEAVVFYDPNLSESDLANVRLGGGADDTDQNYGSSFYDENSCPAIFVTAESGEALKAISAADRKITKASASAAQSAFQAADGTKVAYGDVKTADDNAPAVKWSSLADGDYDYVWCNIARGSGDYDGNDYDGDIDGDWSKLKGKIALVRGNGWFLFEDNVYSYDQMVNQCQNAGAVGVIVFDDRYDQAGQGQFSNDGWLSSQTIPVVQVGYEQGKALRDAATKTITVKQGMQTDGDQAEIKSYYAMSSYSSWGVTPDLKLKPEIAAPGGNVYSSINNNKYAYYSGTSMATPQITGIAALVHQYVDADAKFASLSATAKAQVVTQLLMSTASPMVDSRDTSSYYTPRQQGAGLANAVAATTTDVYATVDGAADASRPKADLGESGNGQWSFTITLHNVGSQARSFTPDTAALSDTVANGLFQQQTKNWTGKGIDVSYSGDGYNAESGNVMVPAGGIANLTVTVSCQDAFAQFANENTPNGTFVDGFAMLKSADEGVDLSVPFMGFYGDWSKASVFDAAASDDYHFAGTKFVDAIYGSDLGVNPFAEGDQKKFDMDRVVVSNSGFSDAPTTLTSSTSLLRNVNNLAYSMTGPDGSDEGSASYDYVRKTYYNSTYKTWVKAEDLMNGSNPVFYPGSSDDTAEGVYTLKMTATTAGPTPEQQTQEYKIRYDTTAPEITDVVYDDNDGDPTLTFTVKDNTYVAAIDLVSPDENGITQWKYFYRALVTDDPVAQDADGNNIYKVQVKVADVKAAWPGKYGDKDIANTVRAYAWDYGKLVSQAKTAVVNPVAATSVTVSPDSVAVAPGQSMPLSATVAPADTTDTELVWSSSNNDVAKVSADGTLTGVAEGTAEVTVSVRNNPALTDTVQVKVANVSADQGIVLSSDDVRSTKDGDAVQLTALLSDSMEGAKLTWESSNEEVFAASAVDGATAADIKGGYQVGDATLTVTAEKDGVTKTAQATIRNRTADYDDFIIDENHVLRGYKGNQTTIVIPNDVTEIGEAAFRGDTQLARIGVPASVTKIGESAFEPIVTATSSSWSKVGTAKEFSFEGTEAHPSQLREIGKRAFAEGGASGTMVLPEGVTTLGEEAFANCMSLNGITLPDSVRVIPDRCFQKAMIGYVEMSDNVTSIGDDAFSGGLFLTQVKLTNTAEGAASNGLPSKLEHLGSSCFSGTYLGAEGVSDIVVPDGVTEIPDGLFSGDRYITSVTLGDGVTSIGYGAFSGMWGLSSFTMPDSVTSLGGAIFQDCEYLKDVTVSRNLGVDQLKNNFQWCFSLEKVNVPDDALNYTTKDGVVYTKDLSELVYVPTAKTGSLAIPEGVKKLDNNSFESSKLSSVTFPSTLQEIEKHGFAKQLDVADFGSSITSIASDAFRQSFYADDNNNAGYTPAHLIVRGGQNGSYADTKKADKQQTAYFGEGMTSLKFDQSGAPGTLVVPASLISLDLAGNAANPSAVTVYAPAGSNGYNVAKAELEAIGADPAKQLKEYTPLSATLKLSGIPEDGVYPLVADTTGGVEGAKAYRFVQQNADGSETVLQDWSSASTINWKAPEDGTTVRAEVRDATWLTADAGTYGVTAPVFATDLDATPVTVQPGGAMPTFAVSATAAAGATLSYQWYVDGAAVDGATDASFTPSLSAGTHTVYVVAKATANGMSAVTKSQVATVNVLSAAQAPVIATDLDGQVSLNLGEACTLKVEADSPDNGSLTYQWYRDGKAIDGATAPALSVSGDAVGTHTYYVVVTNTVNGGTATAQSSTCSVEVVNPNAADTTALSSLIERAEALNESQYTAETWAPFAAALTKARSVLADASATQDAVDEAANALQQAMDALVKKDAGAFDHTKLADGVYDIQVSFRQATSVGNESMMGAVVNKNAKLVVKDGVYTVKFDVHTMSVMGATADLNGLKYYPGGYVENGVGYFQGNAVDCETEGTYVGADGAEHPLTYLVPVSDAAKADGYICMAAQSTYMNATVVFALDWAAFDQQYGDHEVVTKDALNEQLAAASQVTSSDSLEYIILKRAIDAAQAVADDDEATQADVDAQAQALADALKVYSGRSLTEVADGQTWRMDGQLLNKDGSVADSSKYFAEGALVKRVGDAYQVSITTKAAYDAYITGMTYGDGIAAEVTDNGDGTHTYTFTVDSLTNATKVVYKLNLGGAADADLPTVTAYLVLNTGNATLVDSGETTVSKADLQSKVDRLKDLAESDYTAESWKTFAEALTAAQATLEKADATQAEVDGALEALTKAYEGLEKAEPAPVTVDKSKLEAGVSHTKQAVSGLTGSDYTAESWKALQNALTAADGVLADDDATQEQVDAALSALTAAYRGLEKAEPTPDPTPGVVDKSTLDAGITHVKQAMAGLNESDYTAESWKALQGALSEAEKVSADKNATADDVQKAADALQAAYKGLTKVDSGTPSNNGNGGDAAGGNGSAAGNGGSNGSANSGNSAAAASNGGKLTQTGDLAPVAPIVGGGLIAALGAIISAAAMRLRKRNE